MLVQVLLTPGLCLYKIDSINLVSDLHRYESEETEIFWDIKLRLNTTKSRHFLNMLSLVLSMLNKLLPSYLCSKLIWQIRNRCIKIDLFVYNYKNIKNFSSFQQVVFSHFLPSSKWSLQSIFHMHRKIFIYVFIFHFAYGLLRLLDFDSNVTWWM